MRSTFRESHGIGEKSGGNDGDSDRAWREWSHEGLTGEPMVSGNGGSESQKSQQTTTMKNFQRERKKKKEWVKSEYKKKKEEEVRAWGEDYKHNQKLLSQLERGEQSQPLKFLVYFNFYKKIFFGFQFLFEAAKERKGQTETSESQDDDTWRKCSGWFR